jgi:hypothetical protein
MDLVSWITSLGLVVDKKHYFSPRYRRPSFFGNLQAILSTVLGHGPLRPFTESYLLIRASKNGKRGSAIDTEP